MKTQRETRSTADKRRRLPVVLLFGGVVEWTGLFGEFCEANADGMTIDEIKQCGDALIAGQEYRHGGGAAPIFVVRVNHSRAWMRCFCRFTMTDADRRAFASVEKPAVSPALDR